MSRYINADKLIQLLEDYYNAQVLSPIDYLAGLQKSLSQVKFFADRKCESEELVRHAFWIELKNPFGETIGYGCSICYPADGVYQIDRSRYCQNCGAKMDGKEPEQ